jgi:hypothetical protein
MIGGEDDLVLKMESIVEGCNDVCPRSITQERTYQQLEDQHSPQNFKRKRLSEAVLSIQNPCQAKFYHWILIQAFKCIILNHLRSSTGHLDFFIMQNQHGEGWGGGVYLMVCRDFIGCTTMYQKVSLHAQQYILPELFNKS